MGQPSSGGEERPVRHHLAVLYPAYLADILAGRKTVECRFGRTGLPPHGFLQAGDLIWFKEVSGPVRAVVRARSVRRLADLTPARVRLIRREWGRQIRAPEAFWQAHRGATAATLIWLGSVCPLRPFWVDKRDRRAWVVLADPPIPGHPVRPAQAVSALPGVTG